ncbi:MAG: SDR family oxidoreductase [Gammaproteobacteria bacterium]|nr:SDR family oxidoreductase [Gammaproteobacteria bacterium]
MKTTIITGASKGIGRATASFLLENDHRVINLSRTPCSLSGVENIALDLASAHLAEQLADQLLSLLDYHPHQPGQLSLIHNAAMMENDNALETDAKSLRLVLETNLVAPHILNGSLIPLMAPGSSIIYIGSTLAEKAVANAFSYSVSKHAMVGMMRACCQDLAGTGIHTACICPGFTDTEMLRAHVGGDEATLSAIAALSAFNRLIEPEEIARCIYFAMNTPALNGSLIHANLGQIES